MKIKLSLTEAYFIKLVMKEYAEKDGEKKETKLMAQDILNKLKK
jgi:hypothetical protein